MITSDLTIDQLIPHVSQVREEMREETGRVIGYSRTQAPSVSDVLNIFYGIFTIGTKWRQIVKRQSTMLQQLTTTDFTRADTSRLKVVVASIEGGVESGRELLAETNQLGSEIRFWWRKPIREFAQQIEHLDSIAESLRLECEPEVTMLLASAASHLVANRQSSQSANAR